MDIRELKSHVYDFTTNRASLEELYELLGQCISLRSEESLPLVLELAKSDYGGFTHNLQLKMASAVVATLWGKDGIDGLHEMALVKSKSKDVRMVARVFLYLIKGSIGETIWIPKDSDLSLALRSKAAPYNQKSFKDHATLKLSNLVDIFIGRINFDGDIIIALKNS